MYGVYSSQIEQLTPRQLCNTELRELFLCVPGPTTKGPANCSAVELGRHLVFIWIF